MAVGPWGRDLRAPGSLLARAPGWREGHRDHCLLGLLAGGRVTGIRKRVRTLQGLLTGGGVEVGHRDHCLQGL